ncbi:unnamed protein product, partial [marine sediment metagenome]
MSSSTAKILVRLAESNPNAVYTHRDLVSPEGGGGRLAIVETLKQHNEQAEDAVAAVIEEMGDSTAELRRKADTI